MKRRALQNHRVWNDKHAKMSIEQYFKPKCTIPYSEIIKKPSSQSLVFKTCSVNLVDLRHLLAGTSLNASTRTVLLTQDILDRLKAPLNESSWVMSNEMGDDDVFLDMSNHSLTKSQNSFDSGLGQSVKKNTKRKISNESLSSNDSTSFSFTYMVAKKLKLSHELFKCKIDD